MALKELLMHVPDGTGYQAFVGLIRNLNRLDMYWILHSAGVFWFDCRQQNLTSIPIQLVKVFMTSFLKTVSRSQ